MKKERFDYEKFSKEVQEGLREKKPLLGQGGMFTPLLKQFLEAALGGEMQAHMEESRQKGGAKNRRNGKSRKQMQSPTPIAGFSTSGALNCFLPVIGPLSALTQL